MRLIRLGGEPSEVGVDIRAAVSAWGAGCGVLGGVALFGYTPPGSLRPLDAVIVLPHGVIAVIGADLPQPALKLEAPLHTPWQVDGWPLVRAEGAVNPGQEAVEAATALAHSLQSHGVDPLPVATIVAVGPFVEQVTQPTNDLHRGLRVVPPTTTAMLAAARELAIYERACSVEPARRLLSVLDEQTGKLGAAELAAEGFPSTGTRDLGSAATVLIPKVPSTPPLLRSAKKMGARLSLRGRLITLAVMLLVVSGVVSFALITGRPASTDDQEQATRVDGVEFTRETSMRDTDCATNSFGDVQAWFEEKPCTMLVRAAYTTSVTGRRAAVTISVIEFSDEGSADELRTLLGSAGTGGIVDPVAQGRSWPGSPPSFDNAAQSVEQRGTQVRAVRAVWSSGGSDQEDPQLRALTERGLRLPEQP